MSLAIRREVRAGARRTPPRQTELAEAATRPTSCSRARSTSCTTRPFRPTQILRFSRPDPARAARAVRGRPAAPPRAADRRRRRRTRPTSTTRGSATACVRAVPLFVKHDDRMYPQMGLAMACASSASTCRSCGSRPTRSSIPGKDGRGDRVIPHRVYRSAELGEEIATFIDIPWWGGAEWEYMYDHPEHRVPASTTCPSSRVWDLVLTRRKIGGERRRRPTPALISVLAVDPTTPAGDAYAANPPPPTTRRAAARRRLLDETSRRRTRPTSSCGPFPPAELDEDSRAVPRGVRQPARAASPRARRLDRRLARRPRR